MLESLWLCTMEAFTFIGFLEVRQFVKLVIITLNTNAHSLPISFGQ